MSTILYRWGRAAARHPWRMLGAWLAIAVAVLALQSTVGGTTSDDFTIPGTESQRGADVLLESFPSEGGVAGRIVFADPDGDVTDPTAQAAIEATLADIAAGPNVLAVTDPFDAVQPAVSPDRSTAFATVRYSVDPPGPEEGEDALAAIEIARDAGLRAELSKEVVWGAEQVEGHTAETIGLAVAVLVLLVAFGSVIAAGIPIGTAMFGIFIGLGLVTTMAGLTDVPSVAPMIASMIGIGVGIDYALFVVTRHRGFRHEGHDPIESAARANATAGTAVLFAGTTVVIALGGLLLAGIPSIAVMGYSAAITVLVAMLAAVTLLPAFLGLAGERIDRWRIGRRHTAGVEAHQTWSGRWADKVGRRPWRFALASLIGLLALAAPVLDMRTGVADDGSASTEHTYRRAYDMLAEGFGPGFNSPFTIAVDGEGAAVDAASLQALHDSVAATDGIAFATAPAVSPSGTTAVITAFPTTGPADVATEDLVHTLRDDVVPGALAATGGTEHVYVTGQTAGFIDISEKLASRLPVFIAAVVGLSFFLLMLVFRSVLVPLKAAVMNLLSIGGAYGVVVAVFQWGWGNEWIGVDTTVPISPFLPMIMFAILFGLSMDYEVFLLSRVREEWVRTGDSHQSVVDGLASTARVITSAALIMISVFAAFLLMPDIEVKMFAVGLAVAVLIDATIVRMVLVPSTMALMGDANWWLPGWLDRILPHVDVEGTSVLYAAAPIATDGVVVPDDISELDGECEEVPA